MKLLKELVEQTEYISEAKEDGGKEHYIHGIFMQADKQNKNGRIYPLKVMESAVRNYINNQVKNKRAYGELGHPAGPQINLDRVSHLITELKFDGSNVIGKARLTETPMGNIAVGLLKSGANLGVSSRGLGSLKPNNYGVMEVQEDFHLATAADIVADPSAPDAYVKGVMEDAEWLYDAAKDIWYQESLYEEKKKLRRMSMNDIERNKFGVFEHFIQSVSSKTRIL